MNIGKSQAEVLGKDWGNEGENNDRVGNRIGDRYKHDRQQLMLPPSGFKINAC